MSGCTCLQILLLEYRYLRSDRTAIVSFILYATSFLYFPLLVKTLSFCNFNLNNFPVMNFDYNSSVIKARNCLDNLFDYVITQKTLITVLFSTHIIG